MDIHTATEEAYKRGLEDGKPKWILVTERLPKQFESVLVNIPSEEPFPTVHEGFLETNGWWYVRHFRYDPELITHWMPLPEPPKEE